MILRNKKSFTIIEAVMSMIIIAITITPFAILVATVMAQQNGFSQAQATAVALAEGEMERVTAERFSLCVSEAAVAFSAPFAAYTKQIVVEYVNAGALDTAVAGPTDYKRIQVRVNNTMAGTNTLVTILANDW